METSKNSKLGSKNKNKIWIQESENIKNNKLDIDYLRTDQRFEVISQKKNQRQGTQVQLSLFK